jgi:hypothetical protein
MQPVYPEKIIHWQVIEYFLQAMMSFVPLIYSMDHCFTPGLADMCYFIKLDTDHTTLAYKTNGGLRLKFY